MATQGVNESTNFRFLQRLSQRLSAISCFLPRLPSTKNGFMPRLLSTKNSFLQRLCDLASCRESRIARTVSADSHFPWTVVSAGSKRSRTVSVEAKYDGQSLQEAKISGLVYTLWARMERGEDTVLKTQYQCFLISGT